MGNAVVAWPLSGYRAATQVAGGGYITTTVASGIRAVYGGSQPTYLLGREKQLDINTRASAMCSQTLRHDCAYAQPGNNKATKLEKGVHWQHLIVQKRRVIASAH